MNEKEFALPNGETVYASALARLPYTAEAAKQIAKGANPAKFPVTGVDMPVWGILYISESGPGFFAHQSKVQIIELVSNPKAKELPPIHIAIPKASVTGFELVAAKRPTTRLGQFLSRFFVGKDDIFRIAWEGSNGKCELEFFIGMTDMRKFARIFAERIK